MTDGVYHQRVARTTTACFVAALLLASLAVSGCGGDGTSDASPTPTPAPSVSALPPAQDSQGRLTDAAFRVIKIFLKDSVTREERDAMAAEIAAMPEVEAYEFVSKAEALERFREQFGEEIAVSVSDNPLPASFGILLKTGEDVRSVARRFFDDPRVESTPGTHDGVQFSRVPD